MNVNSFKDLIVWQKSIDFVTSIYLLVNQLPKEETYALSDQLRRAVVSI
ncbi:MAG: four helix bundle protein [Arcobacter sp.]